MLNTTSSRYREESLPRLQSRRSASGLAVRQCYQDGTREPEPSFPEVQRLQPVWSLVTEAGEGQDFYECLVQAEVARRHPGLKGEKVKEIIILFDYEAEHTLVYSPWLANMDLEVYPIEPATVTTPFGKRVETRQIAILPLESARQGGKPVLIAARIMDCSMWSRTDAPAMKEIRKRFDKRPTVQMSKTRRKRGPIHLLVGRDNRKVFPEVQQEGWLRGHDLYLCGIPFKPDQVICGTAQRDLRWLKGLNSLEDAKKPEVVARAKAEAAAQAAARAKTRALPGSVVGDRRISVASSVAQSP
jgi:hypothetical protein